MLISSAAAFFVVVVQVLRWMSAWVASANSSEGSFKGADEVARLTRHGVTPSDILAEVCAVWSWLQAHPADAPVS